MKNYNDTVNCFSTAEGSSIKKMMREQRSIWNGWERDSWLPYRKGFFRLLASGYGVQKSLSHPFCAKSPLLYPFLWWCHLVTWAWAGDLWLVTCDFLLVTCDLWLATSCSWAVIWLLICDMWIATRDLWPVTFGLWCVTFELTYDLCPVIRDLWFLICDLWLVICDM